MQTRYETFADAHAAGWVMCRPVYRRDVSKPGFSPAHYVDHYLGKHAPADLDALARGQRLSVRDMSGGHSRGYAFGVFLSTQDFLGADQPCHHRSTTVWFTQERNALGGTGCFLEMFRREELERLRDRFPYVPPLLAPPGPVTQGELDWLVFRLPDWLAYQCPPAERDALAELTPATVRRVLALERRPTAGIPETMIEQAIAGRHCYQEVQ